MKKGFTQLEIIVVLAITFTLSALIFVPFSSFRSQRALDAEVERVIAVLSYNREMTLASKNQNVYGVHFESDKMVEFVGGVYSSIEPSNEQTELDNSVEISNISLQGGGSDIVFKRLTGDTEYFGEITLRLKGDVDRVRVIKIFPTGLIER